MTLTIGSTQITSATPEAARAPSGVGAPSHPNPLSENVDWPAIGGAPSQVISLWIDLIRQAFQIASPPPPTTPGLTARQLNVLDYIPQDGKGITMTQLARALMVTEPCATSLATHLVAVGAISRERDAVDRRLVRVIVTKAGRDLAASHRRSLAEVLEGMLSQLPPIKFTMATMAMAQLSRLDWSGHTSQWSTTRAFITTSGSDGRQNLKHA